MGDLSAKWGSRLSAFEELTSKWRQVGLGTLQKTTLDADALLLTANKDALAQGRKALGSKTREFAQLDSTQKLAEFGSLLKCYQGYVDELTKFLTEAERCYFNLHGAVQGMVDPYPLMDRFTKERNTILEFVRGYEESEGLRRHLKERESELLELQNQEITIKKLRAQLADTELCAMANAEKTASSTQEEMNNVLNQWKLRESELHQELQRSLHEQRRSEGEIKELGNQLATLRLKYSELEELRDSESAALTAELEEAAIQSKLTQREVQRLRLAEKELRKGAMGSLGEGVSPGPLEANDMNYVAALNQEFQQTKDECANLRIRCALLEKEIDKHTGSGLILGSQSAAPAAYAASIAQLQQALEVARDEVNRLSEDNGGKERLLGSLRSRLETAQFDVEAKDAELQVLRVRVKRIEEEKQPLLAAVRDLERELAGRGGIEGGSASKAQEPFDLGSVLQRVPSHGEGNSVVGEVGIPSAGSSDEAFFAVTTQRDRLRQRLLALEEAASQEVEQLRGQLKAARDERDELLMLHGGRGNEGTNGYALRIPPQNPAQYYSPHLKKGRQVVTALDMLTSLLYKHVLSDVWMRRAFLGYLSLLHLFVFIDLFYQTSGFF